MLKDMKKDYITYASLLGDYQSISEQELLDRYCDAKDNSDSFEQSKYISALILRFWYRIEKLYQQNIQMNLDREDFVFWILEAIDYACKYRAWQKEDSKVNAKQAINQCIETIRKQHLYIANLDKHRANYNNISFEMPLNSDSDDGENTLEDILPNNKSDITMDDVLTVEMLVQSYINKKKLIEAIIIDTIAFQDAYKTKKSTNTSIDEESGKKTKIISYNNIFSPREVVRYLSSLPENYAEYFSERYDVITKELNIALEHVQNVPNQKLYKFLTATLKDLKATVKA